MTKTKAAKPPVPTEKQRAVLSALTGGRKIASEDVGGKPRLVLFGKTGKPVANAPKIDRSAFEGCQKKGWVDAAGQLTEDGTKAKRRK